jgi:hypothetical protein
MTNRTMAFHLHEGKQIGRLGNFISTVQTNQSITVKELQRDLANACGLIIQLNDENEELVQNLVGLNRENTELMARLEIEVSKNGNLALQVKILQEKRRKSDLHSTAKLDHTQLPKHTRPFAQHLTKKALMGSVKSVTEKGTRSQSIGRLGYNIIQSDQVTKPTPDKSGDKSCETYGHKHRKDPVLQVRNISQSIPGNEDIDQRIISRNFFMKHQSFVACHSSTGSLMERLSSRHRSSSTTLLSRTYSKRLSSSSFNNLSLVSQRNHSFCTVSRKNSFGSVSRKYDSSADFEFFHPHSPLAIVPLKNLKNEAWCYHSSSLNSGSNGASPDSIAPNRMPSTTDTWTASFSNSKFHQFRESTSSSRNALSNDANRSATSGSFHLDFDNDGTCLRRKPSCSSMIQSDWCSSLSSLTYNTFNRNSLDYNSEHLDYGTKNTSSVKSTQIPNNRRSSFTSSACKTFDRSSLDYCDEHLDFGTDDTGSVESTADFDSRNRNNSKTGRGADNGRFLKGILGRSTQERRKSGTDLLVGFHSRRRSITLRSLLPLLDV